MITCSSHESTVVVSTSSVEDGHHYEATDEWYWNDEKACNSFCGLPLSVPIYRNQRININGTSQQIRSAAELFVFHDLITIHF